MHNGADQVSSSQELEIEVLAPRDIFRESVFNRDNHKCVVCGAPGVDAHHIMERRLFPDGGYIKENGATLCAACHLEAESTKLSPGDIRAAAGIGLVVLPPQLYADQEYDKWGNPVLSTGQRLPGELFDDPSVQRILAPYLHLFTRRVKYPRTWHLPISPGTTDDDKRLAPYVVDSWTGRQIVVTEKMDGENTTMYHDGLHARSLDYSSHLSRERIKTIWASVAHDIPPSFRICGENVTAVHSIKYTNLRSYFLIYSIWSGMECLSWEETMEWAELLDLATVPLIYKGEYRPLLEEDFVKDMDFTRQEGFVIRPAGRFHYRDFPICVGKYVRTAHVQTDEHWLRAQIEYNLLSNE